MNHFNHFFMPQVQRCTRVVGSPASYSDKSRIRVSALRPTGLTGFSRRSTSLSADVWDNSSSTWTLLFTSLQLNIHIHPAIRRWQSSGMLRRLKVKLSRYTPWRYRGGEEVQLLLILNLGTRWGWVVSVTPRPRFTPGERTPVPIG
jgi:hypothetical protein